MRLSMVDSAASTSGAEHVISLPREGPPPPPLTYQLPSVSCVVFPLQPPVRWPTDDLRTSASSSSKCALQNLHASSACLSKCSAKPCAAANCSLLSLDAPNVFTMSKAFSPPRRQPASIDFTSNDVDGARPMARSRSH